VDADELPTLPHVKLDQVWKFGLARVREAILSVSGTS